MVMPSETPSVQPQLAAEPSVWKRRDAWFPNTGYSSKAKSGERVDARTARSISTFWSCGAVIGEDTAVTPFTVVESNDGGDRRAFSDHPAARLLRTPNPAMTGFTFRETLVRWAATEGNGYAEIQRTGMGAPVALWLIHPSRVVNVEEDDGRVTHFVRYRSSNGGWEWREIPSEDMFHVPGPGDGIEGYGKLEAMREALGLGLAGQSFAAAMFANDLAIGAVISRKDALGDEAYQSWVDKMKKTFSGGAGAAGQAYFSNGETTVQRLSFEPEKGQVLETRSFSVPDICRFFRVSPQKVGHDGQAKGWATTEALAASHVQDCLTPWWIRMEEEAQRKLIRDERLSLKFFVNARLRSEPETRKEFYASAIQNGWMSPEEVRQFEDLPPSKDPAARRLFAQGALRLLEVLAATAAQTSGAKVTEDPAGTSQRPGGGAPAGADDEDPVAAIDVVARDAAARVVSREAHTLGRLMKKSSDGGVAEATKFYATLREYAVQAFTPYATALAGLVGARAKVVVAALSAHVDGLWTDPVARSGEILHSSETALADALAETVKAACRAAARKEAA